VEHENELDKRLRDSENRLKVSYAREGEKKKKRENE
jgi:hypothetical protein